MADDLGSVYYTVDADTQGAVSGAEKLNQSVNRTEKQLKGLDTKVTKTAKAVNKGFGNMNQAAQNFSYQIQDIAVQLSMGQSPFLVLGQQLPQLFVGMGAAAAGAGALIAVLGGLSMVLLDSSSAAEELDEALESLKNIATLTKDGAAELTDSIKQLGKVSRIGAELQLSLGAQEARQALEGVSSAITELVDDSADVDLDDIGSALFRIKSEGLDTYDALRLLEESQYSYFSSAGKLSGVVDDMADSFGITKKSALELILAIDSAETKKSEESFKNLQYTLNEISSTSGETTEEFISFAKRLNELSFSGIGAIKTLGLVKKGFKDAGGENSSFEKYSQSVEAVRVKLEEGERAAAVYLARQKAISDGNPHLISDYEILAGKLFDYNQQIRDNAKARSEALAEDKKASDFAAGLIKKSETESERMESEIKTLKDFYERKLITTTEYEAAISAVKKRQRAKDAADEKAASDKLTKSVTGIAESGLDPVTRLKNQRDEQLAMVREYEQLETAEHQTAVDARAAIDEQYNAKIDAAREARFVAQSESNALIIEGLNSLGETASSVLTGMVTQTMSLKDAASSLANAIVNDVVNSLVQVGIQYVKNAAISATADNAVMASKKATQAAAATAHTTAVSATVAELASLAGAAAFASTAAIPITGPELAPAAATAAVKATSALGAPAIASAPVAGMRLYGGNTAPNSMYKVTEDGRAEMFTDGRDSFLMTGSRGGAVTSNGDMNSGNGGVTVVVNNNMPGAQITPSYNENEKTVTISVERAVGEIARQFSENQGKAFQSLVTGTTAQGKAT